MQASGAPTKIYTPFAVNGTKNTIPIDSQVGITPGIASFDTGFPPLTFTPVSAGGVPPAGADFNGILNAITAIQQFQSGGGIYPYDATWSSDNGGYPIGAVLVRADGTGFWLSTEDNNATDPETDTSGAWIPINNQGVTSVALTSANVTLTSLQYAKRVIILTGALTANVQVIFPEFAGLKWLIINQTTGDYLVTCTTATKGFFLGQGASQEAWADGTNLNALSPVLLLTPTASQTLPAGAWKTVVMPGTLTADSAFTLPGNAPVPSEFVAFGSAAAFTTTIESPVASGSPYIEMPDGSQVYSYVIPASSPGAGIQLVWDGTNYRARTFGQTVVGNATASNQAVALGQVLNGVAPVAANNNLSGTTAAVTTGTLTAPCDGYALVIGSFNSGTASLSGTGITASLAGLVEVVNPNNGNGFNQSVWYLPMTKGQSSTFTATLTQSSSGTCTVSVVATFQPNPGT